VQEEALPPVQVACAASWSAAHERRLQDGAIRGWSAGAVAAGDGEDAFDWTFTTPYGGNVRSAEPGARPSWHPVDERIDRTLLLSRDPILFYDELTLYESELDDNGTMSLTAKVHIVACVHAAGNGIALKPVSPIPSAGPGYACLLVCAHALLAARGRGAHQVRCSLCTTVLSTRV
jgi:hypothetical protein